MPAVDKPGKCSVDTGKTYRSLVGDSIVLRKQMMTIDELLQKPYWIIDILPEQVPADSPGQYFAVEKYFLGKEQLDRIKQKHIDSI